mmetsp:Transcript_20709/g.61831  ORF Transcript_20709/g.61831 Transcript_20709/m.61831 type:complete len:234 (-) Transcript_20709:674-1375(-)
MPAQMLNVCSYAERLLRCCTRSDAERGVVESLELDASRVLLTQSHHLLELHQRREAGKLVVAADAAPGADVVCVEGSEIGGGGRASRRCWGAADAVMRQRRQEVAVCGVARAAPQRLRRGVHVQALPQACQQPRRGGWAAQRRRRHKLRRSSACVAALPDLATGVAAEQASQRGVGAGRGTLRRDEHRHCRREKPQKAVRQRCPQRLRWQRRRRVVRVLLVLLVLLLVRHWHR